MEKIKRQYVAPPTLVDALAKSRAKGVGYVLGCLIQGREGDTVFVSDANGTLTPRLLGYVIIPMEDAAHQYHAFGIEGCDECASKTA